MGTSLACIAGEGGTPKPTGIAHLLIKAVFNINMTVITRSVSQDPGWGWYCKLNSYVKQDRCEMLYDHNQSPWF